MAIQNLEITTKSLLSAVVEMPEKKFDKFIEEAKKLRNGSKKISWTKNETKIIEKIREYKFSSEREKRFRKLIKKMQNETISESEFEEYSKLIDEGEEMTAKRLELLVKLASAKNKTLDEIMEILEICPPEIV